MAAILDFKIFKLLLLLNCLLDVLQTYKKAIKSYVLLIACFKSYKFFLVGHFYDFIVLTAVNQNEMTSSDQNYHNLVAKQLRNLSAKFQLCI